MNDHNTETVVIVQYKARRQLPEICCAKADHRASWQRPFPARAYLPLGRAKGQCGCWGSTHGWWKRRPDICKRRSLKASMYLNKTHKLTRHSSLYKVRDLTSMLIQCSRQTSSISNIEKIIPLTDHSAAWQLLPNVSHWVLNNIKKVYRIQFAPCPPHFDSVLLTVVHTGQLPLKSLSWTKVPLVPLPKRESGFYSWYFLVPKEDGRLCPILDLRDLNRALRTYGYKMLTWGV